MSGRANRFWARCFWLMSICYLIMGVAASAEFWLCLSRRWFLDAAVDFALLWFCVFMSSALWHASKIFAESSQEQS